MTKRPVFIPMSKAPFYGTVDITFDWNPGSAPSQKRKNISAIHDGFKHLCGAPPLEISSKSKQDGGVSLSAFNMKIYIKSINSDVPVECAYQGGKVFINGGPYVDLFYANPKDAKRDERLKNSGALIGFKFEGQVFPITPQSLYYDYLWINALLCNQDLASKVLQYKGFTDIEFNPEKGISCQAKAAAIFVALHKQGKLDCVKHVNTFYELITGKCYSEQLINTERAINSVAEITSAENYVKEEISVGIGTSVKHPKFGIGKITKDSQGILEIFFSNINTVKKLNKEWVVSHCGLVD